MQALSSKVLFEYSHLAVFYASIPCVRKVSKKACAELKVIDGKDTCEKGNPNSPA